MCQSCDAMSFCLLFCVRIIGKVGEQDGKEEVERHKVAQNDDEREEDEGRRSTRIVSVPHDPRPVVARHDLHVELSEAREM